MKNLKSDYRIYGRKKARGRKDISSLVSSDFFLDLEKKNKKKIILDIGTGKGESAIFLSQKNPEKLIIAADVYEDGLLSLYKEVIKLKIKNIKIFNKNILFLLDKFDKKNFIEEIWILFPDPWPKKKHKKRRLINASFLKKIYSLIHIKTKIFIATDSRSYFIDILSNIKNSDLFNWINNTPAGWNYSFYDYPSTKYYKKTLINKNKVFFINLKKI